ncbi:hypothetical protein A4H97_28480 [Niastella yeongjuensis]|uniref:Uncharacterized protein n=1 Tax=Niastella yeongjuensis TaxID=354355 RepID=A0A1V9ETQ3_9BACT|nr:hypothetical protein [Niastella yeongjuensis]OQP49284.1 hypothetical protein A4H97_28480 [Niastella yeongjuensis]SEP42993.1 hypothetical protein SAMN05660816_06036 [Niastella yeongjuensis]
MNNGLQLKQMIRYLLLPISEDLESKCIDAVNKVLDSSEIPETERADFIKIKYNKFREEGTLDPTLKDIIKDILLAGCPNYGILFSTKYFDILESLKSRPFMSFDLAVILASHLNLIASFAKEHKMSSSKITVALSGIDSKLNDIHWKDIQSVLLNLELAPELGTESAKQIIEEDKNLEELFFADAKLEDSIALIAEVANKLQFEGNIQDLLYILSTGDEIHIPYLQILHFQCLISAFYNHISPVAYEFSPRGETANWLFGLWKTSTSNPMLNNAKSVEMLDKNWASGKKKGELPKAMALADILEGMKRLGFGPQQELSAWIRRWLVRFIRLNSETVIPISVALNTLQINNLVNTIISSPTRTFGILEQRIVDVCAATLHQELNGWRARGLSDSVNSNNLSKKKLGDCDFQNSIGKVIVAYEAHGGILSQLYLDEHLRTLKRSLSVRAVELESIADKDEWNITIKFVAYGYETTFSSITHVDGINIMLEYITFSDLIKEAASLPHFESNFLSLFVKIINGNRTPGFVRTKVNHILNETA